MTDAPDRLASDSVQVFAINPRSQSEADYWPDIERNIACCAAFGATGVLCFSGNDTQVDPWLVANRVAQSRSAFDGQPLTPLVALNPSTMPPYSAAKMICSIEQIHGGRVALNLITGLSSRDREVLGDNLSHDERYDRLLEYAQIVNRLLADARPVTHEGRYFTIRQATLLPRSRPRRSPRLFLAGHSPAARRVAAALDAVSLGMLGEGLATDIETEPHRTAVHFGLVARADSDAAWRAAEARFPHSAEGQAVLAATMRFTDSEWKQQLRGRLDRGAARVGPYWLGPFQNFQSDCPFLVGGYDELSGVLVAFMRRGVADFILDLPPDEDAFAHASRVFGLAHRRLAAGL